MKKSLLLGTAGAILLTGCTQRITDFTIISTKNIDLSSAKDFKRGSQRIEGKDSLYFLLAIPLGSKPDLKEAIDRGIENVPGAVALVDGVVYVKNWHIGLFGETSYIVEGTPLIDPKLAKVDGLPSRFIIGEWDEQTKSVKNRYVSENEYNEFKQKHISGMSSKTL